jgi:hypothetical protein
VVAALTFAAPAAQAQPAPPVRLSPMEVSFGLTVNGLAQDVNSAPHCIELSLPCTHQSRRRISGLGVSVSVSRNVTDRLAITGEVGTFRSEWDASGSAGPRHGAAAHATSVLVGPKISTGFFYPGNGDRQPGRFFGHVLAGGEASDVVPLRAAFLVGGGTDVLIPWGGPDGRAHALALRLGLDYRVTPGAGRNLTGWRFVVGFVVGPRLSGP